MNSINEHYLNVCCLRRIVFLSVFREIQLTKFSAAPCNLQQTQYYVFLILSHYQVVSFKQQALEYLQTFSKKNCHQNIKRNIHNGTKEKETEKKKMES